MDLDLDLEGAGVCALRVQNTGAVCETSSRALLLLSCLMILCSLLTNSLPTTLTNGLDDDLRL